MRVGIGYDAHRLVEDRKLVLGGVIIPHELGLLGHSDADVLLHAVADALLGGAGLGDIGRHFPDTDPAYKGISSRSLIRAVAKKLAEKGLSVHNVDAVIVAERPKLATFIPLMRENLAEDLGVSSEMVNVKATTTEGLGPYGRCEGIASYAVCTLMEKTEREKG